MADIYFKIDDYSYASSNRNVYFTNEAKEGYTLRTSTHAVPTSNNPTNDKTVIIELYNDKFVLPENSSLLFYRAHNITFNDMDKWDTSEVTNMSRMFNECRLLPSLDLYSFDTSNVKNMSLMFMHCPALTSLDLSSFNTSNVIDMSGMFEYCYNLKTIYASELFDTTKVTNSSYIFYDCTSLVGGNGTTYDDNYAYIKTHARIDRPGTPGFFTQGSRMKKHIIYLRSNSEWLEYSLYQKDSEGWVEMEVYK